MAFRFFVLLKQPYNRPLQLNILIYVCITNVKNFKLSICILSATLTASLPAIRPVCAGCMALDLLVNHVRFTKLLF